MSVVDRPVQIGIGPRGVADGGMPVLDGQLTAHDGRATIFRVFSFDIAENLCATVADEAPHSGIKSAFKHLNK